MINEWWTTQLNIQVFLNKVQTSHWNSEKQIQGSKDKNSQRERKKSSKITDVNNQKTTSS